MALVALSQIPVQQLKRRHSSASFKRLEQGTFQFPTDIARGDKQAAGVEITESELALLLSGIDLSSVKRRKRYAKAQVAS
ncbi:MAG: hypothetical protein ACTHK7_02650 [Aureliella sp.]